MTACFRLAILLVAAAGVTGCAPTPDSTDTPWCDDYGVLMLEAQSVRSAQLLPCVELMPKGWSPGSTHIDEKGTTFTLHSESAGRNAARIQLAGECSTDGYVRVPSDEPDTQRFEMVTRVSNGYAGTRIYVFSGGCTSIDFAFDTDASAALANEVSLALGFVLRDNVNQAIREITNGREQLDPVAEN